jgi:hypothetical protein
MGRAPGASAMLVLCLILAPVALVRAEVAQKDNVRVAVSGKMSPSSLPRDESAPIAVSVGGEISSTDETPPPQLKTLKIEINRHGHLDNTGLPTCRYNSIQPASTSRALAACRPALVGEGRFTANVVLQGQEPYPTEGRLLVFNGERDGKPVLFGQIYAPRPFANSFVIVFTVKRLSRGTYGTALMASLPAAMGNWGYLTGMEMHLGRRYRYRGKSHSFLSASCPAPKGFGQAVFPLARTSFDFAGSLGLSETLTRSCKVR